MARVKQSFDEVRYVPWVGRDIQPGEILEVPDDELASYLEGGWEPADGPSRDQHARLLADGTVTVRSGPADNDPEPVDDSVKES